MANGLLLARGWELCACAWEVGKGSAPGRKGRQVPAHGWLGQRSPHLSTSTDPTREHNLKSVMHMQAKGELGLRHWK